MGTWLSTNVTSSAVLAVPTAVCRGSATPGRSAPLLLMGTGEDGNRGKILDSEGKLVRGDDGGVLRLHFFAVDPFNTLSMCPSRRLGNPSLSR